MCGRLSQVHLERMRQLTELAGQLLVPPRYNIPPPTQIESCSVITTNANEAMSALHDRMPALLEPAEVESWLDPRNQDPVQLQLLLRPSAQPLVLTRVSPRMNSPKFDDPACIESVA